MGTFPVILLKLATPPFPPQTKMNFEQNELKWVEMSANFRPQHCWWGGGGGRGGGGRDDEINPKPNKKLSLGAGSYVKITWKGFFTQPQVLSSSILQFSTSVRSIITSICMRTKIPMRRSRHIGKLEKKVNTSKRVRQHRS